MEKAFGRRCRPMAEISPGRGTFLANRKTDGSIDRPQSLAYPVGAPTTEDWARLPTRNMEESLMDAAGRFYGVPAGAGIVAASGAQALINGFPGSSRHPPLPFWPPPMPNTRPFGVAPDTCDGGGKPRGDADVVVVVSTAIRTAGFSVKTLLERAGKLASGGGLLIVDEAFADSEPALSLSGACGRSGLVVLKSFGKFFGLAGLRLGFAIGPRSVCRALADCLGPWAVATPALSSIRALGDRAWAEETRRRLREPRLNEISAAPSCGGRTCSVQSKQMSRSVPAARERGRFGTRFSIQ